MYLIRNQIPRQLILGFIIALTFISIASATDIGTIKLKNGEVYENVPYEVNDFYKTVLFTYQGQRINVEYSQIESITNGNAEDITSRVLENGENGDTHHDHEYEQDEKTSDKSWSGIISAGGSFTIPLGDYYDGLTSGFGFNADFRVSTDERHAVQFLFSRSSIQLREDNQSVYNNYYSDATFHITRFEVAVNIFDRALAIPGDQNFENRSYGLIGFGLVRHSLENSNRFHDSKAINKFSFIFGGGVLFMTSNEVGIDLSAKVNLVFPYGNDDTSNNNLSYLVQIKASMGFMY